MVFVTGDLHGNFERFKPKYFPEQARMTKQDTMICAGDFAGKLHLLMDYTDRPRDVADPWYTEDFESTWRDVLDGCQGLLKELLQERGEQNGTE